ncbi:MAG: recT protein [Candidatus Frackibacter sp. T328-2]|nr:MAG: recT protein [Candidatus Frackibacter sp. T328-2]
MSNNELAMIKKDTVDVVTERIREFQEGGEIDLPPNYSVENAMKSAWLELQSTKNKSGKPVLQSCSRDSIANSLLDMAVQGLNPAKNQCYFVAYGNKLVCMRSYFGTIAVTKQFAGAEDVYAQIIYKGDDFEYEIERGRKVITKHKQSFANKVDGKPLGAYAVITFPDERPDYVDIMTMDQIKQSWKQGQTYKEGGGSPHNKFTEEMAKKTVINRTCKAYINSSNDSNLMIESFNRVAETKTEQEVQKEVEENANSEVIDIDTEESNDADQEEKQETEQSEQELEATGTEGPGF